MSDRPVDSSTDVGHGCLSEKGKYIVRQRFRRKEPCSSTVDLKMFSYDNAFLLNVRPPIFFFNFFMYAYTCDKHLIALSNANIRTRPHTIHSRAYYIIIKQLSLIDFVVMTR